MSLAEYQRKRDFGRTPEPKGRTPVDQGALRFAVHRHDASHLHWDVRLEMRGVLASWAIPNGPPLEAGKRRLAVHTEDHPIEYLDFHGVIPDGYGAGTMTIWDTGTYDLLLAKEDREFKVHFHGNRLQGEWVLVHTGQNAGRDWLMIKHGTPPKDDPLAWRIEPQLIAVTAEEPFDSPDFAHEIKWDGVRVVAFVDGGEVRVQTRRLLDRTKQYPELQELGPALTGAYQAIVDGEIVALDEKGVPSFQRIQSRMNVEGESEVRRLRKTTPVVFYPFDILWADGVDLRPLPLRERVARLDAAITPMGATRKSERFVGDGIALAAAAKEHGFEGVVAKRLDAPYTSGRSATWIRVKNRKTIDCVIGGWTDGQGARASLGSVLVGVYRGEELVPLGGVGSGFSEKTVRDVLATLRSREQPVSPFASPPKDFAKAHWVAPELVCEVEYTEITGEGQLRQPVFVGLRSDKDPRECVGMERAMSAKAALRAAATEATAKPRAAKAAKVPSILSVDGHSLRLTNLEKVLFPEDGYTKADLIRYYTEVSPYLLPWLRDRPLTLKPFPDGIAGASFYQKDKPEFTPRWIRSWRDEDAGREGGIDYVLANDLATLIWLANYTAIEIHPWLGRVDKPDLPDTAIIDLDPSTRATWDDVREAARLVHEVLDAMGLVGVPKTTGSRGIHILVPIERRYSYEESRGFVDRVGKAAREKAPKLITLEFQKDKRRGIYVDFLQNVRGKTTAGPYSVRPIRRAPVSAPLAWDELGAVGRPDAFTIATMTARLAAVGDLLAPAVALAQRLPK
ncbi:MAG: DNA ligase D [Chloroflexi bacterium]|nr:DNA ligase D [Chloroflexota bacterium]